MKVVKDVFHLEGRNLFQYLDDWLGDAENQAVARQRARALIELCQTLGFIINYEKSELEPTQSFDFVGMHIDLRVAMVFITPKNLQKVISAVELMLGSPTHRAHQWLKLIGTLTSQELHLPFRKLHKVHSVAPQRPLE